jgi:hypothetical protein
VRVVIVFVILAGCGSSAPPPKPASAAPPANAAACENACMSQQSVCTDKCLESDHAPPEGDDDGCAARCERSLESCRASCH